MGAYINPRPHDFRESLNSRIYVDKTMLIREANSNINTQQKFMCVSRPRRFGKSMAMNMLAAYYSCGEDTHELFENLKISTDSGYEKHINKYNVIKINIQPLLSMTHSVDKMLQLIETLLTGELRAENPGIPDEFPLAILMQMVFAQTGKQFIILIDEWDCLFREFKEDTKSQQKYLDFLRMWLKDQSYVALAYMTGILPIKKYGTHSALNMFSEYSMTNPGSLAPYFGFTENEVKDLCEEHGVNFEDAKAWYDGYELIEKPLSETPAHYSLYSPRSVVESIINLCFDCYWNQTETYEALRVYIERNIEGLKDTVIKMLSGETIRIDPQGFTNDMTTFANRDDLLTLLVHLGYLSYNFTEKTVRIPNKEVSQVYITSIERMPDWSEVAKALEASRKLIESLWEQDEQAVSDGVEEVHQEISILKYNDENSLSCCIQLAFYFAREYYTIIREMPTGRGFADVVYIPRRRFADKPAIVIELKKDKTAQGAIAQIHEKHYCKALEEYKGNLLLCGINYDTEKKKHDCRIEKLTWGAAQ